MEQQKKVIQTQSVSYELRNKVMWLSKIVYEDGSSQFGIDSSKKGSLNNLRSSFANYGRPEFITEMGSVNSTYKDFFVVKSTNYLYENCPQPILEEFFPLVCINPMNPNEVALMCNDGDVFYIWYKGNSFIESLENCLKELYVNYLNTQSKKEKDTPKINSWILQYISKQQIIGFRDIVSYQKNLD